MANFARALPQLGWDPYVLTLEQKYIEKQDAEKRQYVAGIKTVHAGHLPTLSDGYLRVKRWAHYWTREDQRQRGVQDNLPRPQRDASCPETNIEKWRRYLLSFSSLPDPQRSWMWPAVLKAVCLIRREKIEAVVTSCPPYSGHLVGLIVAYLTGVRWIADFRDPWTTTGAKSLYYTCDVTKHIERGLERYVVRKADAIIANTHRLREALKTQYSNCHSSKFDCITNGYDEEFFSRYDTFKKDEIFTIIYAGTLYFGRTPEPIFQAMCELIGEGCLERSAIRMRFIGHCEQVEGKSIGDIVKAYGLEGVVEVLGAVSYINAIEMIRRSHLALLLAPNQPYQIPAKVYDYIGAETEILALANEGATRDLIRSSGIGGVFAPDDVKGMKEFIADAYQRKSLSNVSERSVVRTCFGLRSITKSLVAQLEHVCGTRG